MLVDAPAVLHEPRVTACNVAELLLPRVAAMELDWQSSVDGHKPRVWRLPAAAFVAGPAPARFSVQIIRRDTDAYLVRLVWNDMQMAWSNLRRDDLIDSSLGVLLGAMGTSLECLLDQPVQA